LYETEIRNKEFENIEKWNNELILKRMLESQSKAFNAVKKDLKSIEMAVSLAVKKLKNDKAKIVYVGAGTSGRIGILDGVELIPTFGWPENRVDFCFSGIDVKKASEGSEDNIELALKHFKEVNITEHDVVLCLAASGSTIYTNTILEKSKSLGALTVSFTNNKNSKLLEASDVSIYLNTGHEFLAGSTRLSAGTSQKIALNLFSTCLMIRLNKVYKGFMVDMKSTNAKLCSRAEKILAEITSCDPSKAYETLLKTDYNIKLSIMMINNFSKKKALEALEKTEGNIDKALKIK
jgi:N-acetylmuramic acid 6-phosphate etherase